MNVKTNKIMIAFLLSLEISADFAIIVITSPAIEVNNILINVIFLFLYVLKKDMAFLISVILLLTLSSDRIFILNESHISCILSIFSFNGKASNFLR